MKLSRIFVTALLAGTLAVLGCGDDGGGTAGSGGTTGTGGTAGTGGGASGICAQCDAQQLRGECEEFYDFCVVDDAGTPEDCAIGALAQCGIL